MQDSFIACHWVDHASFAVDFPMKIWMTLWI